MSASESYLDQSITMVKKLRRRELGQYSLGTSLGSGSGYRMHHLAQITLKNGDLAVGLKLPHPGRSRQVMSRLMQELGSAILLTERVPETRPLLPAFMGLLAIKGQRNPVALLTEDASRNDALTVEPMRASEGIRTQLADAFCDIGPFDDVIREEELDRSVAFDVAGTERWLDLTPSPINTFGPARPYYEPAQLAVFHSRQKLTCTIPADSVLARDLEDYR